MAIYKLVEDVDQLKGSRGGAVFQRCGKVFALRSRKSPLQKKTPAQTSSRNLFESIATRWPLLSGGQQATFNANAEEFPRINSLGQEYTVSGQNIQQSSNTILHNAGQPPIDTLPNTIAPSTSIWDLIAVRHDLLAADYVLFPALTPAGFITQIWSTPGISTGVEFVSASQFRLIKTYGPGESTAGNIYTDLIAVYPIESLPVGLNVWGLARFIAADSGQVINQVIAVGQIES